MQYQSVLAVDVGSTTTKALLMDDCSGELRLRYTAETPTTSERPVEDVMIGVQNALERLEQLSGRQFLQDGKLITPANGDTGVDKVMATSSAGGGLQMVAGGIWQTMTVASAKKAALGAGAIVMDVFSTDDSRSPLERIRRVQELGPDIILLSGGVDGGNTTHVTSLAELVALARPQPRLSKSYTLPVVYAGNSEARVIIDNFLEGVAIVKHVPNLRPDLETEELGPARQQVHDLFREHVMTHAPGSSKLLQWCGNAVLPTPDCVGRIVDMMGERLGINVVAVDIGGATTDVFSSASLSFTSSEQGPWDKGYIKQGIERKFHCSVNANLGMSYSIGNILAESGIDSVRRWLPFAVDEGRLRDWCCNKMIRPTTLPQSLWTLLFEQACAREVLRLAFDWHMCLARGFKAAPMKRSIGDILNQDASGQRLFNMMEVDAVIGSGGVLAHAPRRSQAMSMMLDSLQPQGVTEIYVDSVSLMPQLGALSAVNPEAAVDVFLKDCLVPLGTCVAPVGSPRFGNIMATVDILLKGGKKQFRIRSGELAAIPHPAGQQAELSIRPVSGVDVGAGPGKPVVTVAVGGHVGIVLDGRNRPINFPRYERDRVARLQSWYNSLNVYPEVKGEMVR